MAPFRGYGDLPGTLPIMPGLTGMPAYRPRITDFVQPEDIAPAPEPEPEADSIYKRALDGAASAYRAFESAPAVAANYYAPGGNEALSEGLTPRLPSIRDLIESGAQTPDQPASDTYGQAIARKVGGFAGEMAASPTNAALLLASGGLGAAGARGATARAAMEGVELAPEALAAAGRTARYGRIADLGQRAISLGFGASMLPGAAEHLGEAAHTLESEGVNPHSVAEATGSGLEALLAGAALGHGFFPSTPARAGSARPFDERSDPASRQVFPIDEPLARNAPPPRGTPAPPVDIGAAATTMPDLGRGAIPLPDLDRMINERLARLGGGGEPAAPFTAPEAPYEVQPFGEEGHGPSPSGYQPEPPPVDVAAEREFLRPNLQALADAEQARRAREFLSTPRPELRPIEPSGFTPPEEPFTVPEGPAHFEPPAGLPLPEQFLEEGVRNAIGEGGAPPRLGSSLPAISGPGAEDVSFSPRAAEAAADQGVKVEPRAEARPTISGRDDVEAARLAKNIEGTPDAELRRRETFYQRTRFKKSLSIVKDEIARRQQDAAAAPEVEAARQKTTREQLSPAEAADVAWALGPGRGRDINSMTIEQARDLIAPMRRAKEMREAQAARAAAPTPEAAPPAEAAPAAPTAPSPAQAIAGNYPKGHVKWNGLDISIETPKGTERVAHDGSWRVPEMPADYGYVKRTVGADSEHVDVYMGDHPDADTVYVIDQKNLETGAFDEHKAVLGAKDEAAARDIYERAFTDGKGAERAQDVTPMSVAQFKAWLHGGDLTKAAAETVHTPIEAPAETAKAPSNYSETIPEKYSEAPPEEERRRDSVVDRREQDQPVEVDRRLADRRQAILDEDPSLGEKAADRIARAEMRAEESDARATSAETEAGRDTLTGVESANAYRRSLKAIEAGEEPKPAKVSEFDIAGVGAGNVQIGEPYMDARLQAAGEAINHVVGDAGRVFRKGGDEFVIHWKDSATAERLHPEVAEALNKAHIVVDEGGDVKVAWTGVEHYGGLGDDFNEASRALYELKPKRGTPEYKQLPKGLADKIEQGRRHGNDLPAVERGVRGSREDRGGPPAENPPAAKLGDDQEGPLGTSEPTAAYEARAREDGAKGADEALAAVRDGDQLDLVSIRRGGSVSSGDSFSGGGGPDRPGAPRGGVSVDAGSGVRTTGLAVTLPKELTDRGWVDLRGQEVKSPHDLAAIAQVYRDPRFETFRLFYTKADRILAHEGVTTRMPGHVVVFEPGMRAKQIFELKRRMERLGADGYYMLHNHPSGRPIPSVEDINLTRAIEDKIPGFKGHVVIDHDHYGLISPRSSMDVMLGTLPKSETLPLGKGTVKPDEYLVPSIANKALGRPLLDSAHVAKLGYQLTQPEASANFVTLLYRDSRSLVRAIQEMPVELFSNPKEAADYIRGRGRAFGAPDVFAYHPHPVADTPTASNIGSPLAKSALDLIQRGVLTDAIIGRGQESLQDVGARPPMGTSLGVPFEREKRIKVSEDAAPYDAQPKTPEDLRTAADAARERLTERGKAQANDLGAGAAGATATMGDLGIVGADLLARGYRNFGVWGREMLKASGDEVPGLAPQLRKVWQDARQLWKGANGKPELVEAKPTADTADLAPPPPSTPPTRSAAGAAAPAPTSGLTLPEETLADKTASYFQDRLRRLDVVEKSVGAQGGKVAPQGENVKAAADALGAKVAAKHEQIRQEFVDPLVKTLGDAKVPLKDLDDYVSLLHAPDRDALVAKRTDGEVKNGSGWSDQEQAQGWADLEKKYGPAKDGKIAALEPAADLVRGMRDEQMKLLQDGGLISKDQADAWRREMGEHYVPMRTAEVDEGMGTGQGFDIRGKESKAATGRSTKADSPVSFMVNQLERAAVRAEKNKVDQRFADFVRENKLFEMDKEHERTELGADGRVKKVRDVLRDQQDFTYKVNGETHRIDIASVDPLLDKAMRNASVGDRNIVVDKLGTISRHFSKAVTSWNPAFMFTNFARDIQEAIGNAGVEHGAEVAKNILQGVPGAMREMYRMAKDPKKASQMARDFKADGGAVGWYSMTGVPEFEKELTSRLDSNGPGVARAAKRTFQRITQSVADATGTTENATRFAVYKALRDGGASREKAAWAARNATLDFTKKGEAGPTINALYTFFNANVQGMKRLKEVAIDNPKGRALAGGIVAAGMAMDAYNRAMAGDGNKDGINDYDAIPEHVKARNWVVMRGAGKKPITIPIPYGFSIFQTVGRQIMSSYAGATTPGKAAMSVVSAANNAFNPLGGEGGLVQSLSPTFLDPFIQHATNTSWSGQPLMPDAQPGQAKPASERYFKNAPPAAIAIARWLNDKTGGDKVTPGLISVSPEVLSLYTDAANNMFGVGSYAKTGIQAAETVKSVASGETPSVRNIPVANRFVYEESPGQEGQIYRANMDELDTLWSRYNSYKKEGKADAIKAMPIGLLRAKRAVAPIDSQIDQIKKSAKAHPDKQDRADELIGELQVKANRIISEARQTAGLPANPQE